MWPQTFSKNHPVASLLKSYTTKGCPADCGTPWTRDHIEQALKHGPHKSAREKDARDTLCQEMLTKIRDGFAKLVQYGDIKDHIPKHLKIFPVACIPQKSQLH